ncbi:MAG: hypothetical protein U1E36_00520 [Rickettsiales bacterium]
MSQLMDEINQLDLNAPDVKRSELLQMFFTNIDAKFSPENRLLYADDIKDIKQRIVAVVHPYKLSSNSLEDYKEMVKGFNPNGDDTATGREIADAMLTNVDGLLKMTDYGISDATPEQKEEYATGVQKFKTSLWGKECKLGDLREKSFEDIFGTDSTQIESFYGDLWLLDRVRQNPLMRRVFLDEGDQRDFIRLPHAISEELPQFIQMPDGEDICNALKKNALQHDPHDPIITAEHESREVLQEKVDAAARDVMKHIEHARHPSPHEMIAPQLPNHLPAENKGRS